MPFRSLRCLPKLFVISKKQYSEVSERVRLRYKPYGCVCFLGNAPIPNKIATLGQPPGVLL